MGVGSGPKSAGGSAGGSADSPEATGLAAIARYGVGDQDPETGLYECYDVPDEVTDPGITVLDLLDEWPLVVPDFATEYGIRLAVADMSWVEFWSLLTGLLSTDSRLQRRFASKLEPEGD